MNLASRKKSVTPQKQCHPAHCVGDRASTDSQHRSNLPVTKPLRPQMNTLLIARVEALYADSHSPFVLLLLKSLFRIGPAVCQPQRHVVDCKFHAVFSSVRGNPYIDTEVVRDTPYPPAKILIGQPRSGQMLMKSQESLLHNIFSLVGTKVQPDQMPHDRAAHFRKQVHHLIFGRK